jgi:alpha-galactosidase
MNVTKGAKGVTRINKVQLVIILGLVTVLNLFTAGQLSAQTVWLDQLDLSAATQGFGVPKKNKSVDGRTITIAGKTFERGFGTHAESSLLIQLNGKATLFTAQVGIDDEVSGHDPAVEFVLYGDKAKLWSSGILRLGDAAKNCSVQLTGVQKLELVVTDGGNGNYYDHADWADAKFETNGASTLSTINPVPGDPYILTPEPPAKPRINGASVFGVRPGSPFQFRIAATGDRPMSFSVKDLPTGLKLDSKTGIITGKLSTPGTFIVALTAKNAIGTAERKLRIACGDRIALTPPMGWNSWNCFAGEVSADKVKRAADAMVKSGLVNHGWTYINIDDFWQNHRDSKDSTLRGKLRDEAGNIIPNSRFRDMKPLADYVHDLGLKIGLYSSPGPWTCGGCAGSYGHEQQDAESYAEWGFDYLKYDWCSYGSVINGLPNNDPYKVPSLSFQGGGNLPVAEKPYELMGGYLRQQPRDIVFSLCQYGMSDVWKWGDSVNGNSWRTTNDITDTWTSVKNIALAQDKAAPWAKPGNWNDPDMLVVGTVGWGNPHPSKLKPDEQYLHFSLWCLFSAPLLIGCDMEKLDAFTLNLLANDEVIAVNQDPLGKEATCAQTNGDLRIYVKELEGGSRAVGFCNFGLEKMKLSYKDFEKLGITGKQKVRDLWRQKDIGTIEAKSGQLPVTVPVHGVLLYKFTPVK